MIVELVTCDVCDWTDHMRGSVVPKAWIVIGSKHYCSTGCAARAWSGDAA